MPIQNDKRALARKHIDRQLAALRGVDVITKPPRGWLRAVRDALGMTTRQFARRLGVTQASAVGLERNESRETITLGRLRAAAEALDCTLVYALVPRKPLQKLVEEQASRLADQRLERLHHTMGLEDQTMTAEDLAEERQRLVNQILASSARRLWDEP